MKYKGSGEERLKDAAHLIVLISFTCTAVILLAEIIVRGWERVAVPLVLCAIIYSWGINLVDRYDSVHRMWIYAIFMMFCYFFYGIHQTRMDILPLAIVVIIMIFFITGLRGLIWLAVGSYYFTMLFNIARADGKWVESYHLSTLQMLLHFFLVLVAGIVAHFFISARTIEHARAVEKKRAREDDEEIMREQFRIVSKEIGGLSRDMMGEMLLLKNARIEREEKEGKRSEVTGKDEMDAIFAMARRLVTHLDDMMDYSEMIAGRTHPRTEVYEVMDLLAQLRTERHTYNLDEQSELVVQLDPLTPKALYGDKEMILKILRHLISNGRRYTVDGGVQVKIYTNSHADETNLCIEVNDTGVGIGRADLERLVESIDDRRTAGYRPGGLGLGLYLVSGFVKHLGGFFRIESENEAGTSVCVSIPQRVADAVPCISFGRNLGICIAYEDTVYKNDTLNGFYEELIRNFSEGMGIPAYSVRSAEELDDLCRAYNKVCLIVDHEAYSGNPDRYESMEGVFLSVVTPKDREFPEGSSAYRLRMPFETSELLHMLERAKKTIDRRGNNDEASGCARPVRAESLSEREIRIHGGRKVMIVTDSMSDMPPEISRASGIPVIPFRIFAEHASFLDGLEVSQECALSYFKEDPGIHTMAPEEDDFREFFEKNLRLAEHLIYISTARRVSVAYDRACKVAEEMGNVTVFNSGQVSGGVALMAIKAQEQVDRGATPGEIVEFLEKLRPKVKTTFLIENLDHLAQVGTVSRFLGVMARIFMIHPVITMKHDAMTLGAIHVGSMIRAKEAYINRILRRREKVDFEYGFIGSVGIEHRELSGLEQVLLAEGKFQHVIVRRASAAISINCGAGTFGIIYIEK
ncbi:MAG: DegV family EDD domain-containing protein [Eubacterium sp.]|nr:DegV family EDD domain-containing protein [Eubacterium sp.]